MTIVQLIGGLVGASITAYLLTGFITLFMRGRLKGINGSTEDLSKARNAMWFRASLVALVMLAAVGLSQVAQGAAIAYGLTFLAGGSLVVWEFWRRPRS